MKFCAQSELTRATILSCIKANLSKLQIKELVCTSQSHVEAFVQDAQHAYSTHLRSRARVQLSACACVAFNDTDHQHSVGGL